ncbi:hypothetical protein D3C71_1545240 [compost metagenome]
MQLPAQQVRVDVVGRHRLCRVLVIAQLVGVVRHIEFFLARQLEIVTVHRAVEHECVVVSGGADGAWVWCVVGQVRRQFHPTLSRQVLPGTTRLFQRVDRVHE